MLMAIRHYANGITLAYTPALPSQAMDGSVGETWGRRIPAVGFDLKE